MGSALGADMPGQGVLPEVPDEGDGVGGLEGEAKALFALPEGLFGGLSGSKVLDDHQKLLGRALAASAE